MMHINNVAESQDMVAADPLSFVPAAAMAQASSSTRSSSTSDSTSTSGQHPIPPPPGQPPLTHGAMSNASVAEIVDRAASQQHQPPPAPGTQHSLKEKGHDGDNR